MNGRFGEFDFSTALRYIETDAFFGNAPVFCFYPEETHGNEEFI